MSLPAPRLQPSPEWRSPIRALAMLPILGATLAGCRGSERPGSGFADAYIRCVADRTRQSVSCSSGTAAAKPVEDATGTAIVLTAQHGDVELRTDDVRFVADDVSFAAAIRNLAGQPIGTRDGRTPDPRGIVLRVVEAIADLDSLAGTAAPATEPVRPSQPAWAVATMLDSGETTAPARLSVRIPAGAGTAVFGITVTAPVRYPRGWMRVQPVRVAERGTVELEAVQFDAIGRRTLLQPDVQWTLAGGAERARLTPSGQLEARLAGLVTVVATCEDPCDATPDTANVAIADEDGVTLSIDPRAGHAISRYIYGANFLTDDGAATAGLPPWYGASVPRTLTLNRLGGNRFSAYNWRANVSNAGADYRHQNDRYLDASTQPGEAIRRRVMEAQARGAGTIVTIPMLPFVANDDEGVPLDTAGATRAQRLAAHFVPNRPAPQPGDPAGTIHQSEFVRWLDSAVTVRHDTLPLFWSLDNEPDIWHATHREIMSDTAGRRRLQTYDGFSATSIAFASAVKAVLPRAVIFGPATATYAGIATLGQTPDPDPVHGSASFLEVYLDHFRKAEQQGGRRLLDVLDVHWYPEMATARGGGVSNEWVTQDSDLVALRVQATRSLWDSTWDERSWVSGVTNGPVALIPRLRRMIAGHYPGTALSISEYFYGRAGDIAGGLAQADALGIFGREGVFAATFWPQAAPGAYGNDGARAYAYAFGAFRLFTDYDGAGHGFGRTGVGAWSSDDERASVYASRRDDGRLVLVLINRTLSTLPATIPVVHGGQPATAQVWTMRHGAPVPERAPDLTVPPGTALGFRMPAMSASTLVLDP
ncbi:MAG: hypothetical protein IT355_10075 [Gemmatimonadaceae bacterium]|nr:hypothetical protein [Gemmatimonadaceae bacterium]